MSTVTLHMGAFKTGTSFVQSVLMNSRQTLAELGVLWPGEDWGSVVQGVQGLLGRKNTPIDRWTELVAEIDAWRGQLLLPSEHHAWAIKRSRRMVSELTDLRPTVIGDLDDLVPRFTTPLGPATTDPSTVPVDELLAAAAHGLVGMSEEVARLGTRTGRNS